MIACQCWSGSPESAVTIYRVKEGNIKNSYPLSLSENKEVVTVKKTERRIVMTAIGDKVVSTFALHS